MCSNINRLTAHKRHFPLILRAAGLLLIVLIAVIAGTTLITRAARTGADCLKVVENTGTTLIDPNAKRVIKLDESATPAPTEAIRNVLDNELYLVSPDGKHLAHLTPNSGDETQPSQLVIDTFNVPLQNDRVEPLISWSPDGERIAYLTFSSDHTYFTLSDINGLHKQTTIFDRSKSQLALGNWTADGKYVPLITMSTNGTIVGLTFWRTADLSHVDFDAAGQALLKNCQYVQSNYFPSIKDKIGLILGNHYFTCNVRNEDKSQVIIADLDKGKVTPFDFTMNNVPYSFLNTQGSTDNTYLAVGSFDINENVLNATHMYIINVNTLSMQEVGDTYAIEPCSECSLYPSMAWSSDGKTLVYMRHSQYEIGKSDVMLYYANTDSYQYLFTIERPDSFNVLTSLNNQSVVWILYTTLDTSQSRVHLLFMSNLASVDFPVASLYGVNWSLDGVLAVLSADLANQQYIDFFDKQGAFMYHVKGNYITHYYHLDPGLTWTSCKPDGFDLRRRAT